MSTFSFATLVLCLLVSAACGGTVFERSDDAATRPEREPPIPGADEAPGEADELPVVDAPVLPRLSDSGTLIVDASARAFYEPRWWDGARVELMVTVRGWPSGEPIQDAEVVGGPLGEEVALVYDVYSHSTYGGSATTYQRAWSFSVTRGDDYLTGLVLFGPSVQSMGATSAVGEATITWSPWNEEGVTSVGCARRQHPQPPAETCAEAKDPGALTLAFAGQPDVVATQATLARSTDVPVGLEGTGSVTVSTTLEVDP